jgi:hypothetical protein
MQSLVSSLSAGQSCETVKKESDNLLLTRNICMVYRKRCFRRNCWVKIDVKLPWRQVVCNVASLIEGKSLKGDAIGVPKVAEYNDVGARTI